MRDMGKRIVGVATAVVLAVGGLVGCGPAAPKTAQELVERNAQLEDRDNYHSNMTMDISISLFGQEIPVGVALDMDVLGDNAHGTSNATVFGEDIQSEIYVTKEGDDFVQYASTNLGDTTTWTKATQDHGAATGELVTDDLLADAQFEATEEGYVLKVSGAKLMEALGSTGELDSLDELLGDETLGASLDDSTATLTYDKDCRLTGIDYVLNADLSQSEGEGLSLNMGMSLSLAMTLDGYGTISEEDVAVPEEVKKDATDADQITDAIDSLLGTADEAVEEAEAA